MTPGGNQSKVRVLLALISKSSAVPYKTRISDVIVSVHKIYRAQSDEITV